ncbi:AaceriAFR093Wp [[Ashbya] aceris (nom. inval.)]|nr:AaceriAFR093Wp [[Ashbya] aceris (nom. inval.)]
MEFELFNGLNQRQYEAVTFDPTKALQIVAGPGAGKTKVLTTRYAYLVAIKKINPLSIIMTTFTKKAADEIKARVEPILQRCGFDTSKLLIGTFHSICANLLHQHGELIGLPSSWRVFSPAETDPIIKKLVADCPDQIRDYALSYRANKVNLCLPNRNGEWALADKAIRKNISRLKAEALSPEAYKELDTHDEALYHFYRSYQEELLRQGGLDYDDLLFYSFKLLSTNRCWSHIKHVMVDEFQDTNSIQLELMYLLSRGRHQSCEGVTVVGDPDQSIYAFRSALARNFEEMIQKCPIEYGHVVLEENYRSTQNILDTSEHVIKQQSDGRTFRLPLKAQFSYDLKPVYMKFPDRFLEGPTICKEILYLKAIPGLFSYDDFAILVRQRRQIEPLERALIDHRIPYKIVKSVSFWERKETKAILDLIKIVCSDVDRYAIIRSLKYPSKGLGDVAISQFEKAFDEDPKRSPLEILRLFSNSAKGDKLSSKGRLAVRQFIALIDKAREICNENPTLSTREQLFDYLYDASGLKNEFLFEDDKGERKTKNLGECEPNNENKRHRNIQLVKSHFLAFIPEDMDPKYTIELNPKTHEPCAVDTPVIKKDHITPRDTSTSSSNYENLNTSSEQDKENRASLPDDTKIDLYNLLRRFINFINLYTTTEAIDPKGLTKSQQQANELRVKNGVVTITTIHGSKGLEWPIVFIPGCVEGIIPCVYANSKDGESDDDDDTGDGNETEELPNTDANSPKKNKSKANEGLDEERRMFFVALTRAKYLLYISATENTERYPIVPSQFLTPEVLVTLSSSQQLFDNVGFVDAFYKALNRTRPNTLTFKLEKLLDDYRAFVTGNREFLIWKNERVMHVSNVDFTENVGKAALPLGFTTASMHLLSSEYKNNVANSAKGSTRNLAPRPQPLNNASGRQFAPSTIPSTKGNGPVTRQFAPRSGERVSLSPTRTASKAPKPHENVSLSPTRRPLHAPKPEFDQSMSIPRSPRHETAKVQEVREPPETLKIKERARSLAVSTTNNQHRITAHAIKLEDFSDDDETAKVKIKCDDEITAAQLLHNPDDLRVDNRPILTNAKVLADASRDEAAKRAGSRRKVKKGTDECQPGEDILSRLKRARKSSPSINDEVIVLD